MRGEGRADCGIPWSPRVTRAADLQRRRKAFARIALTVILLGGGIGAVSTLHAMDWGAFGAALAGVAALPLALAIVVSTAQVYAQLARFVVLVPAALGFPRAELLDTIAVGQLLNYATPLRAGDAYKVIRLAGVAETTAAEPSATPRLPFLLAALLAERVADIAALLVMAAWASFPELLAWSRTLVPSTAVLVAIGLATVALAIAVAVFARPIQRLVGGFLSGVRGVLLSPRFALSLAVSFATWGLDAGTLYWTSRSVGAYVLPFREIMHSVFVLNVGIAVPVTVGNLGVFEASLAFALSRHGVAPADALAIAMVEHFVKFAGLGLCVLTLRAGNAALRLRPGRPGPDRALDRPMNGNPLETPSAPPAPAPPAPLGGQARGGYQDERRSVLLLLVLSIITLGIYPAVWFFRRRRFLDSLDSSEKLGSMAAAPLVATVLSLACSFLALPSDVERPLSIAFGAVTIITAFRVAKMLRSDFARTGRFLSVSGVATFFFNALYLQYKINQAADTPPAKGALAG